MYHVTTNYHERQCHWMTEHWLCKDKKSMKQKLCHVLNIYLNDDGSLYVPNVQFNKHADKSLSKINAKSKSFMKARIKQNRTNYKLYLKLLQGVENAEKDQCTLVNIDKNMTICVMKQQKRH